MGTLRLLHVSAGNLFGGIETFLKTLFQYQKSRDDLLHEFAFCFRGQIAEDLQSFGACVHFLGRVRTSRPWTILQARKKLQILLARTFFDAVIFHGTWPHAILAPAARKAGRPIVFWAHGPLANRHWLERWARRTRPDRVVANSHFTEASIPALWPDVSTRVIYCPVSPPELADHVAVRREIRELMEVSEEAVVILIACRMEAWKGHTLLFHALEDLCDLPQWVCWIAGGAQRPSEAHYLADLQAEVKRNKINLRVKFLGQRSDVPRLLAAADILCQPNLSPEPFGITFIEALYARRPVVTTAMGGALEIVNADCGFLVPPKNVLALAAALRTLITNSSIRENLGSAGPARANALCDPQASLDQLFGSLASLSGQAK